MKKAIYFFVIAILTTILSCSSAEENPDPSPVVNSMSQGTWRVSDYIIGGDVSVSSYYTDFNFTFGANDILTATNGTDTFTGTWFVRNFDNEKLKFVINYDNPEAFTYLTNSWRIRSRSANQIILDINEFNYVIFEKNE